MNHMLDKEPEIYNYQVGAEFVYVCSTRTLSTSKQEVSLNRAEREVLHCLITNAHRVVSFDELLLAGWPHKTVSRTSLFQTIRNLRIKLRETEKGEFIALISSVGYQIEATKASINTTEPNVGSPDPLPSNNKIKRLLGGFLSLTLMIAMLVVYSTWNNKSEANYFYHVSHNKDNSSIVYLTKSQDKLDFIESNSNAYITPMALGQRLFFITKMDDSYSIAYCDKNDIGLCIPSTAKAISFSHTDINLFWQELAKKRTASDLSVPLLYDEKNIQNAAKSYNLYIDNGKFIPNLNQYYFQKTSPLNWRYTAVYYRKFNNKGRFTPLAFNGGDVTLSATDKAPFIAKAVAHSTCTHTFLTNNEIEELSDGPAGQLEKRINNDYNNDSNALAYILFRQNGLILWYTELDGFFWFNKDQIMESEVASLAEFEGCKDYLALGVCRYAHVNTQDQSSNG